MNKKTKHTKIKSNKQEKSIAGQLNARTVIASGSIEHMKGDVRTDQFLIECKTTQFDFYHLTYATWNKIEREALKDGMRMPLMQIDLKDGKTHLAVMKYLDFIGLDFDEYNFISESSEPRLISASSVRITDTFFTQCDYEVPEEFSDELWHLRQDIKFVDYNTHLVILLFDDLLRFIKLQEATQNGR